MSFNVIEGSADHSGPGKADGASRAPSPDRGTTIEGYIDGIQERRVYGWAWCRNRPSEPVDVEIRFDDQALLTVRADCFRQDLAKAGLTDGRHAYEAVLEEAVAAGDKGRISAWGRCSGGDPWVPLVNRTTKPVGHPATRVAASSAVAADLQPVLNALAAVQKKLEERIATWRADLRTDAEGDAQAVRDQLTTLASSLDVLQMRVDALCATMQESTAPAASSRRGDRTLTLLVTGLGIISGASLLLGLFAVFG